MCGSPSPGQWRRSGSCCRNRSGPRRSARRADQDLAAPSDDTVDRIGPARTIAGVFWASGPLVLVLLIGSQLAAFATVAVTLDRGPTQGFATPALAQDAASASLVGLGTILPLLVFQLDYDIPLGFPNELVIIATALVFGAATVARRQPRSHTANLVDGLRTQGSGGRPSLVLLVGAGLVALVGDGLALGRELTTDPQPIVATETAQLTLVSWNLHYRRQSRRRARPGADRPIDRGTEPVDRHLAGGLTWLGAGRGHRHGHLAGTTTRHEGGLRARGRPTVRQRRAHQPGDHKHHRYRSSLQEPDHRNDRQSRSTSPYPADRSG